MPLHCAAAANHAILGSAVVLVHCTLCHSFTYLPSLPPFVGLCIAQHKGWRKATVTVMVHPLVVADETGRYGCTTCSRYSKLPFTGSASTVYMVGSPCQAYECS